MLHGIVLEVRGDFLQLDRRERFPVRSIGNCSPLAQRGRQGKKSNFRRRQGGFSLDGLFITLNKFDKPSELTISIYSIRSDSINRIRQPVVGDGKVP